MKQFYPGIINFLGWACHCFWPLWASLGPTLSTTSLGLRVFQRFLYEVWERRGAVISREARAHYPDLKVTDGLFAGLRYPSFEAIGSSLYPKLSGIYESELIEKIDLDRLGNVELLVDIGCAEGYYAVGFAKVFNNLVVHAYDTSSRARSLCEEMARLNDVSGRVSVKGACFPNDLLALEGKRAFVISDCEGYEWELFNSSVVGSLGSSDCLIEVHEKNGKGVKQFCAMFSGTHDLVVVDSIPDAYRPKVFAAQLGESGPYSLRLLLAAECRASKMQWLYAKSKRFR